MWLFPPFVSTSGFRERETYQRYEEDATVHLSDSASRTGLTWYSVPRKAGTVTFFFLVPTWYLSTEFFDNTNSHYALMHTTLS